MGSDVRYSRWRANKGPNYWKVQGVCSTDRDKLNSFKIYPIRSISADEGVLEISLRIPAD